MGLLVFSILGSVNIHVNTSPLATRLYDLAHFLFDIYREMVIASFICIYFS